jgi:DNA-binding CsgD family transcriptional regulator
LVGTTSEGLFILDENGNILRNISENTGLPTSTVLSVNVDNHDNIWMGLDAGVASLDMESKETFLSSKPSIGIVRSILPVDNTVYAGSNQGIFKLLPDGSFHKIEGTSGSVWSMHNIGGVLVYNHDLGLFRLEGEKVFKIKEGGTTTLAHSFTHPGYYAGADYYGFSLYKMIDGKLEFISKIKGYDGTSRHILFDKNGYLWLMIPKNGFVRLSLSKDLASIAEIKEYNRSSSVNKEYLLMTWLDDHIVYYDGTMPYAYNPQTQELSIDKGLSEIFSLCGTNLIALNQFDNVFWYQTPNDIGYVVRTGNKLEKNSGIFSSIYNKRIYPFVTKLYSNIYAIGYQSGIGISQQGKITTNHLTVRKVEAIGVGQSLFYNFDKKQFELPHNKKIINIYPVHLNANHIVEYRILQLDTVWTKERIDDFLTLTNLESGTYTIQLRNESDKVGHPAQIVVKVDVPWYIGVPMLFVYFVILCCIVLLIALFYKRRTDKEKRRIERIKQAQVDKLEKENLKQSQLILELEKDKLAIELEEKDKQLALITMNSVKRNDFMNELKQEIQETEHFNLNKETEYTLKKVIKKIDGELDKNDEWELFAKYFNLVFGGLLERLSEQYPQLSQSDLKLLAYIKLNLNNKEIANLLNISHRSVEMAKYRIRKKLNLDAKDDFYTILNNKN